MDYPCGRCSRHVVLATLKKSGANKNCNTEKELRGKVKTDDSLDQEACKDFNDDDYGIATSGFSIDNSVCRVKNWEVLEDFLTEHGCLVELMMWLPLLLMVMYIVFYEQGPLIVNSSC